ISSAARVSCLLYPQKTYKTKRGLGRHEKLVHPDYNIPRDGVATLPFDAVNEFKKMLVYLIQKKLSNNSNSAGEQCLSVPCMESQFVAVFGGYLRQYIPSKGLYKCDFSGEGAYEMLSKIFEDPNWGIRQYAQKQKTAVILLSSTSNFSDLVNLEIGKKKNHQKRKSNVFGMNIEWQTRKLMDAVNHTSQAGYITIRFMTDTGYF
ncbi:2290_t:CDS:1, partial [Scutellospora calospora]